MLQKISVAVLLFVSLVGCSSAGRTNTPVNDHIAETQTVVTVLPIHSSTPIPTLTATEESRAWVVIDSTPAANRVRTMLIDRSGDLWAGGPSGVVRWDLETDKPTVYDTGVDFEYENVVALIQAPDDAIWVGTFGNGIGIFNNGSWQSLNVENGLPGNYVISLTTTVSGEIWADLKKMQYYADRGQEYHFGRFEGTKWIEKVGGGFDRVLALLNGSIVGIYNEPYHGGTFHSSIGFYDGQSWNRGTDFSDYIDAITVAPDGVIWIATGDHLFRYVGRTLYKIIPPWAEENFVSSVTSIAVADDGTAWFGFSHASFLEYPCGSSIWEPDREQGVYRYDGKTWTHFTTEDGLVDNKICAITMDVNNNVWFGSFNKGISRFDGRDWKSYVIP